MARTTFRTLRGGRPFPSLRWVPAGRSTAIASSLQTSLWALVCLALSACGSVTPGERRLDRDLGPGWPKPIRPFREASFPALKADLPIPIGAEYVDDDSQCASCHQAEVEAFSLNVHHGLRKGESCEACHGPGSKHVDSEGKTPGLVWNFQTLAPAQRSEICLRCHEKDACAAGADWRTSVHAHRGLSCLDCHTAHYDRPAAQPAHAKSRTADVANGDSAEAAPSPGTSPASEARGLITRNLGAEAPGVCYRCHGDLADQERLAGPHQINGPNGFQCTSCHDPHGRIYEASRRDLCLTCHQRHAPTMAWHSSIHGIADVACTDCHNPHPRTVVGAVFEISHSSARHPQRRAMSVQQPEACYSCHPGIYALTNLPSHHPIPEGKLVCSDCHDPHGQAENDLREPTLNQVCYRCHAEKQGPFAYEHPPVTEDCAICHEPHGTVANSLLRQPATFLCLRCHSGHRSTNRPIDDPNNGAMRSALYADCTQCHSQIHGSDRISEALRGRTLTR